MVANASEKAVGTEEHYSLAKILGIWAAVAVPMAIMGWGVFPALAPDFESDPLGRAGVRIGAITVGLIWDCPGDDFRLPRRRRPALGDHPAALVAQHTARPKTGEPRRKLWLWLIPIVLLHFAAAPILLNVGRWAYTVLPFLAPPPGYGLGAVLESPEVRAALASVERNDNVEDRNLFDNTLVWMYNLSVILPKIFSSVNPYSFS